MKGMPIYNIFWVILIISDGSCRRTHGIQCVSVGKDAHRADLVAIKKELDKGGVYTVVVTVEYSDWSTSLNHLDIMDMVISHCGLVGGRYLEMHLAEINRWL